MVERMSEIEELDRLQDRFQSEIKHVVAERIGNYPSSEELNEYKKKAEEHFPFYLNGHPTAGTEWFYVLHLAAMRTYLMPSRNKE